MSAPASSAPLRVLHVVDSLAVGGMENGVVNIANALAPRGIETHVCALVRRGAFADRLPRPELLFVAGKRDGFTPAAVLRLAAGILRLRPHVVHSHNLGPLIYASLATLGGRLAPILHGEHSLLTADEKSPRRLAQRQRFYRSCRVVHTVSQPQLDELVALGFPAAKIRAIINGVDTARFAPGDRAAAREQIGIPRDAFVIGIVSRFGAHKRHDVLIRAFEQLAAGEPRARLLVVGTGGPEEHRVLAQIAASPQRERIHVAGFQAEPRPFYQALDVLAIPSVNEGLSNAVLEAMACGVPALANLGCGHEQVITSGSDGVIADLNSPESLAAELQKLLAAPERLVDLAKNARTKVALHFSLTAMTANYENLYRSLAGRTA